MEEELDESIRDEPGAYFLRTLTNTPMWEVCGWLGVTASERLAEDIVHERGMWAVGVQSTRGCPAYAPVPFMIHAIHMALWTFSAAVCSALPVSWWHLAAQEVAKLNPRRAEFPEVPSPLESHSWCLSEVLDDMDRCVDPRFILVAATMSQVAKQVVAMGAVSTRGRSELGDDFVRVLLYTLRELAKVARSLLGFATPGEDEEEIAQQASAASFEPMWTQVIFDLAVAAEEWEAMVTYTPPTPLVPILVPEPTGTAQPRARSQSPSRQTNGMGPSSPIAPDLGTFTADMLSALARDGLAGTGKGNDSTPFPAPVPEWGSEGPVLLGTVGAPAAGGRQRPHRTSALKAASRK